MAEEDAYQGRHDINRQQADKTPAQIEAETERVLTSIKRESGFPTRRDREEALRDTGKLPVTGIIEPDDITPDAIATGGEDTEDGSFAHGIDDVDELAEDIDFAAEERQQRERATQQAEQQAAEQAEQQVVRKRRSRLRTLLVLAIVVLVGIAAVIGVLVWNGKLAPNVAPSDTEELTSPGAGTGSVQFEAVENDAIPQLVEAYGLTIDEVGELYAANLIISDEAVATSDERVKGLKKVYDAQLVDSAGKELASVGLGVNKKGKVVYIYCLFDLDALSVADATFAELTASDVVASSLLAALGVDESAVSAATLTASAAGSEVATASVGDAGESDASSGGDAAEGSADAGAGDAVTSDGADADASEGTSSSSVQSVSFEGATGLDAPATWELAETYDSSIGEVLGDNSVTRKVLVELY